MRAPDSITVTPDAFAAAAESLAGCMFRLHGRDPATGLDCIGLFSAAAAKAGLPVEVPQTYTLRTTCPDRLLPPPAQCGFVTASGAAAAGDALLLRIGPAQVHLVVVLAGPRHVHAHAGLRRVVVSPGLPAGDVLHHWRLPPAQ